MDELERLVPLLSTRTTADALGAIDSRTSEPIRAAIARHPAAPDATREMLANVGSPLVRFSRLRTA